MRDFFNKVKPHLIISILFLLVSVIYFSPILEGKKLIGGDTKNWMAMDRDLKEYREEYGKSSLWTGGMFCGMPSYVINVSAYRDVIINILRLPFRIIPRPAEFLFFLFMGFYLLAMSLKIDFRTSAVGAFMFGFSTYFITIILAGHDAKTITIYITPFLLAGMMYVFRKKYILGFVLTSIFAILNLHAGHPQMSYYYAFLFVIIFVFKFFYYKKKSELSHFFKSIGIIGISGMIAILVHMQVLLPLNEYTKETIRGKANLTLTKNEDNKTSGLDRDYITAWSYGKVESLNLFIPNIMGGNSRGMEKNSKTYKSIVDNVQNGKISQQDAYSFLGYARTYWGPQPFTEGPTYLGAVVVFLFVLGLFVLKENVKWWILSGTILSLMMAWGKNLSWFTDFMIDYFPLYNKFRAPSSALVIVQLTVPLMAILALKEFFSDKILYKDKVKYLKYSAGIALGICVIFGLGGFGILDYMGGAYDQVFGNAPNSIQEAIADDRKEIAKADAWRSFIFVLLVVIVLYFASLKGKLKYNTAIIIVGILSLIDLWVVDKRYLNEDSFIKKSKSKQLFVQTNADKEILKDKSYYRVLNTARNTMNDSETSYWHNSIGGYHAAKLRRYQELYDHQISKNNMEVVNMLNTKYFIVPDQKMGDRVILNPDVNGSCWLVDRYTYVDNSDQEIKVLDTLKTKHGIVVDREYQSILGEDEFRKDDSAYIKLVSHNLQEMKYEYFSKYPQLAVFSEMYYKHGWNAYIDGKLMPHFRANYVLRAMKMEQGIHSIVFKFEPKSVETGSILSYVGYMLFAVSLGIGILFNKRKIL